MAHSKQVQYREPHENFSKSKLLLYEKKNLRVPNNLQMAVIGVDFSQQSNFP